MTHSTRAPGTLALAVASTLASALLLTAAPAWSADKADKADKTAAKAPKAAKTAAFVTVNGTAIPQSLADAFVNEQLAQGAPDTRELRDAVRQELIRREVMSQEARKLGLDKRADVAAQMDMARQAILLRAFVQDHLKANPVTEADLTREYDRAKASMSGNEYKSRHVLVDKEEDAKAIIEKLGKGANFADLAKDSKDPGSKDSGGELGWSAPTAFVKPFADALAALEKGKFTTTPVKTEFGYHVILLEDTRPMQPPPFEQIKGQIQQFLQQQRVEKLIGELTAKAKVE